MCEIMDEIRKDGFNAGIEQGQRQLVLLQYRDGDITLEKACTYLNLSEEEFLKLEKLNN